MTSTKIIQFSRPSTPCPSMSDIISNETPSPLQNDSVHVNERYQSKNKTKLRIHLNWPHILLFDLAGKQCYGIIKGLLHCLTSESKRRFLVNNILTFGWAWCLVMAQIQFSLIKKMINKYLFNISKYKIGHQEHPLSPLPLASLSAITSHFRLSPIPLKMEVICDSPLIRIITFLTKPKICLKNHIES